MSNYVPIHFRELRIFKNFVTKWNKILIVGIFRHDTLFVLVK